MRMSLARRRMKARVDRRLAPAWTLEATGDDAAPDNENGKEKEAANLRRMRFLLRFCILFLFYLRSLGCPVALHALHKRAQHYSKLACVGLGGIGTGT